MGFSQQDRDRIVQVVEWRIGTPPCALCGGRNWDLNDEAFIALPLQQEPGFIAQPERSSALPFVALVCTRCGNTHLLNLNTLGLGDVVAD